VTEILEVDPDRPDRAAIDAAARVLVAGGLAIIPTETVYGLAARPDDPGATDRVFQAKERPRSLNLPILSPSADAAWEIGFRTEAAERLAASLWPGPVTLVLPRTERSRPWALGNRTDTVAVRVPAYELTMALLRRTGALAATSANPSGRPALQTRADLRSVFEGRVDVILVPGPNAAEPSGTPSTVVDCSATGVRILRIGAIHDERIREILRERGPLEDQ
jgi:L-threonylcarbamoyladenylate synthase